MMEQRRTQARPIIIRIIKAQDLPTADWDNNLADPYVAITVLKVRPHGLPSTNLLGKESTCMGKMAFFHRLVNRLEASRSLEGHAVAWAGEW